MRHFKISEFDSPDEVGSGERNDHHTCVLEYRRNLPTLDRVVKEMICIPVGWWVSEEDREYIVNCIKEGW